MKIPKENIKLLLVDDEDGIRTVLGITLKDMGYTVFTAENGIKAMDIFQVHNPEIVISDVKMPVMDGIKLLKAIKDISIDTEVIMITGHGDTNLAIKSLKYDACDFITKPIQNDALEIAIKRAIKKIEMRHRLAAYTQNLEELVAEKSKKLVEAERLSAIGQTVAGLSHSIKNIASSLKGGAFIIEKGIETGNQGDLTIGWEMVKKNIDRITTLSMDLLNYAKTSSISQRSYDPNQSIQEVFELFRLQTKEKKINLSVQTDPIVEPIHFDPETIHRCLINLVLNAIDACEAGNNANERTIQMKTIKPKSWGVEFQIIDNGCGIHPNDQKKLFHFFFSTKGSKGTGIGLMMVKNIVDRHQGELNIKSTPQKGTRVSIRLP